MKILAIAGVTVRETLSRKVQVNLLLFGLLLLLASFMASALTVGEMHRILADLGLSAMGLVSILLATFVGASLVAGDVERRVIYPVVAKPISRAQYLIGRYLGLAGALTVNLLALAALLSALLTFEARSLAPLDLALAAAVGMLLVKTLAVAAVAVLFSSFTSTTLAAIFTLSVAIAGHLTNNIRALWQGGNDWIATFIWYALPNLGSLTVNDAVIYRSAPPATAWLTVLHAALYTATALALAAAALERRDFR